MKEVCRDRTGKTPHDWQLDIAEALLLGLDCLVLSRTGSGKTFPFALPVMVPSSERPRLASDIDTNEDLASTTTAAQPKPPPSMSNLRILSWVR